MLQVGAPRVCGGGGGGSGGGSTAAARLEARRIALAPTSCKASGRWAGWRRFRALPPLERSMALVCSAAGAAAGGGHVEMSAGGRQQEYAPLNVADNQEGVYSDGEQRCGRA